MTLRPPPPPRPVIVAIDWHARKLGETSDRMYFRLARGPGTWDAEGIRA